MKRAGWRIFGPSSLKTVTRTANASKRYKTKKQSAEWWPRTSQPTINSSSSSSNICYVLHSLSPASWNNHFSQTTNTMLLFSFATSMRQNHIPQLEFFNCSNSSVAPLARWLQDLTRSALTLVDDGANKVNTGSDDEHGEPPTVRLRNKFGCHWSTHDAWYCCQCVWYGKSNASMVWSNVSMVAEMTGRVAGT
jgi:hypothetical protein